MESNASVGLRVAVVLAAIALLGAGCFSGERQEQERELSGFRTGSRSYESVDRVWNTPADAADHNRAQRGADEPELEAMLAKEPTRELVREAVVRRNPDAVAALERWTAFLERVPQKTSLPFPSVRYGFSTMFKMHTVEVMQEVPFPTKLATEGKAALADARAMGAEAKERMNVLREQADMAYAGLYLAQRELAIVDENLVLLGRFVEIARAKYSAGTAKQPDLLRAEVEHAGLRADRAGLARQIEVARSALNVLLDRDPEAPLGPVKSLPVPSATSTPGLLDQALERRPELTAARERTGAADAMLSRAHQEWIPDFVLGAAYVRDFGMQRDRMELTGGITLPIWVPRILAGINEAKAEKRRMQAEARSAENRVLDEVKSAQARLIGAAERHAILADDALPKARQNVTVSEAAYTTGGIDFLALIDAQRMLLMKQLETERALADYAMRRAELERAVGGSAER